VEVFLNHSGFLDHIQLTHAVGLPWTSDQLVAEASTYTGQHIIETQETNIHALSGIRTRDLSNQAAADLRLRRRGYRGPQVSPFTFDFIVINKRICRFRERLKQNNTPPSQISLDISNCPITEWDHAMVSISDENTEHFPAVTGKSWLQFRLSKPWRQTRTSFLCQSTKVRRASRRPWSSTQVAVWNSAVESSSHARGHVARWQIPNPLTCCVNLKARRRYGGKSSVQVASDFSQASSQAMSFTHGQVFHASSVADFVL
jgi:hypothetical protein